MKLTKIPQRVWINQPSTLQASHKFSGTNGLAIEYDGDRAIFYFLEGDVVSMVISRLALSSGWLEKETA